MIDSFDRALSDFCGPDWLEDLEAGAETMQRDFDFIVGGDGDGSLDLALARFESELEDALSSGSVGLQETKLPGGTP